MTDYRWRDIGDGKPVRVQVCHMCGVDPSNVYDCGEFGNPECPYFEFSNEAFKMLEKTRYQTFVFKGEPSEDFNLQGLTMGGMEMTAWAKGQALEAKEKLEDFIRDLAYGEIDEPEEAAQKLMDEMGWS